MKIYRIGKIVAVGREHRTLYKKICFTLGSTKWHSRNLAWDLFIVGAGLLRNQYTQNTDHQKSAKKSYGLCGTGWPGVCWPCCFSTWATLSTQSGHPSWVSLATLVGPVGSLQSFWSPSSSTPSSSEGLVTRQFNMQARDSSPRSGLLFHVHCPKLNMAINVFVSWWKKEDKIFWYFWHIFSLAGPSCQGFSPLWLTRPSSCRSP